jgi:hypothetical protein
MLILCYVILVLIDVIIDRRQGEWRREDRKKLTIRIEGSPTHM